MCSPRPPEYFQDELNKLDPTGRTRIEWDESVRRWAVTRDGTDSSRPRFFMHVCDPIISKSPNPLAARMEDSVQAGMELGVWVWCEKCGEVHGTHRDPCWYDLDTLMMIAPELSPDGPRQLFRRRRAIIQKMKVKNEAEAIERRKEIVDRATWNLRKSMFHTPHVMSKEDRIEAAKRREKVTQHRLRDKGLVA